MWVPRRARLRDVHFGRWRVSGVVARPAGFVTPSKQGDVCVAAGGDGVENRRAGWDVRLVGRPTGERRVQGSGRRAPRGKTRRGIGPMGWGPDDGGESSGGCDSLTRPRSPSLRSGTPPKRAPETGACALERSRHPRLRGRARSGGGRMILSVVNSASAQDWFRLRLWASPRPEGGPLSCSISRSSHPGCRGRVQ